MTRRLSLLLTILFFSNSLYAEKYLSAKLLARGNSSQNFNLPQIAYLDNFSPVINNRGEVSFVFKSYLEDMKPAVNVWFKSEGQNNGQTIYNVIGDYYISRPSLNNLGVILFNVYDLYSSYGIYKYEKENIELFIDPDQFSFKKYSALTLNDNNDVLFRGQSLRGTQGLFLYNTSLGMKTIYKEGTGEPQNKVSFIFAPAFSNNGNTISKVRLGETRQWSENRPDEIRIWKKDGTFNKIAIDGDGAGESQFTSFFNNVAISSNGVAVFVAKLKAGKKQLLMFKNGQLSVIAQEGVNDVETIENFAPVINKHSEVAFRAINSSGKRSIYFSSQGTLHTIASEGDIVDTDLGTGRIWDEGIGFSGGIDMNDSAEIVFSSMLTGKMRENTLGIGIFKINAR